MRLFINFLLITFITSNLFAQSNIDNFLKENEKQIFANLINILSISNNALEKESFYKNIKYLQNELIKVGIKSDTISTGRIPLLYFEKFVNQNAKTVLFYLQLDGQPVDTSKWNQENPYNPVVKKFINNKWEIISKNELDIYKNDLRIFARSASDAKGPIAMFITALQYLNKNNLQIPYNIKVVFDTEEEISSPNLAKTIERNTDLFNADMMVILDGPRHITNEPTLIFGARGIATLSLTTYGPRVPQHSGHYGNYAPNPALTIAHLLSSFKDENGKVLIPNFYKGINLSKEDYKALKSVPDNEEEIRKKIGISNIDNVGKFYQESIQFPSFNINGITSAWTGKQSRTIVPAKAEASIDIRLVPESDAVRLINSVKKFISDNGYYLIDREPREDERLTKSKIVKMNYHIAYPAFRTKLNSTIDNWLSKIIYKTFTKEPIKIRMTGGSVPIAPFVNILNVPAVILPTVNPDNNQHSPNENIRLGNYIDGIKTFIILLTTGIKE